MCELGVDGKLALCLLATIVLIDDPLHVSEHSVCLLLLLLLQCHVDKQENLALVKVHDLELVLESVQLDVHLLHAEKLIVHVVVTTLLIQVQYGSHSASLLNNLVLLLHSTSLACSCMAYLVSRKLNSDILYQ